MGIKQLSKTISKFAPRARVEVEKVARYAGHRFAIDVPIFMYKFAATLSNPIDGFVAQIATLVSNDIIPIYVFDGKTCEAKEGEMQKRRAVRKKAVCTLQEAKNEWEQQRRNVDLRNFSVMAAAREKYERAKKRVESVPKRTDYTALETLLKKENVKYLQAPNDAEKLCCQLVGTGQADIVVSEDFDVIPYLCTYGGGCGKMLTGLGRDKMVEYDAAVVLESMQLSPAQFVDLCILSGCDFCSKIKNVAGQRAYAFVKAHGGIEGIVRTIDRSRYPVPDNFNYAAARAEFGVV